MAYPPSGPNVPPPPGGQPPSGPYGGQPGSGYPGAPGPGGPGPGQPGQYGQGYAGPGGPGQPPKKKGIGPGIIAAIVGGVLLLLLICCGGGFFLLANSDDESSPTATSETSEPTEETSEPTEETSEPTSETQTETDSPTATPSPSSPQGDTTSVAFPDSFDGWTKQDTSVTTVATYRKDSSTLSAIATAGGQVSSYERVWDDTSEHGDISCGKLSSSSYFQCAGEKDGSTVLVTASTGSASETASTLQSLLDAI